MCCELSGGHFAEDRRTFCRKKADILPNMGGHSVEWWTFCRSPRARVRSFRSPASPTRGLAVHPARGRRSPFTGAAQRPARPAQGASGGVFLSGRGQASEGRSQWREYGAKRLLLGTGTRMGAFSGESESPAGSSPGESVGGMHRACLRSEPVIWIMPGHAGSCLVISGSSPGGAAKRKDERRSREGSEKRKLPRDGSRRFRRCPGRCREIQGRCPRELPGRFRERRRGAFPPGRRDVTAGCQDGMPRAGRNQESAL